MLACSARCAEYPSTAKHLNRRKSLEKRVARHHLNWLVGLPQHSGRVDMSTVYPDASKTLARLGSEHAVDVLDVTISGSTPVAQQDALTLFGDGDRCRFDAAESILRAIARKYFYVSPSGSGATMKLVVNSLAGNRDASDR
jgi:3-hydroxyisobutyrate dehydrogenase